MAAPDAVGNLGFGGWGFNFGVEGLALLVSRLGYQVLVERINVERLNVDRINVERVVLRCRHL